MTNRARSMVAARLPARLAKRCDQGGFVLVMLSLIMTVMFLMAGFAVDLGYWYLRTAQIQRASDAAALAASIDMPDETSAINDALESASKNGFVNGVDGVSVTATPIDAGKISVSIRDPHVDTFFTRVIFNGLSIGRTSTAQRMAPIPMGTPFNRLGSGWNQGYPAEPPDWESHDQHFWLAVNGYCTPKEDGDMYLAAFDGNRRWVDDEADHTVCAPGGTTTSNTDYRSTGYNYSITLPGQTPGNTKVRIYDAAYRPWGCSDPDWQASWPNDAGALWADCLDDPPPNTDMANSSEVPRPPQLTTIYTLYDTLNTDPSVDDVELVSLVCAYHNNNQATPCNDSLRKWKTIYTLLPNNSVIPHRYRLNVRTAQEQDSFGVNNFSIWADAQWTLPNDDDVCDNRTYQYCPMVSGDGAMSIMADSVSDSGYDTFYLAEVDEAYAGDIMTLTLWDPGEGFEEMRLMAPDGRVVPIRWQADPAVDNTPSGAVYGLDVSNDECDWGNCDQPGPNRGGDGRFNDRKVIVTAKIPSDYASYLGPNGSKWWSVQYQSDGGWLHDRTTWAVSIGGHEPVHLVEN